MDKFEKRRDKAKWLAFGGVGVMGLSFFVYLSIGERAGWLLLLGALCYAGAWVLIWRTDRAEAPYGFWPYKGKWNHVPVPPADVARRAYCLAALVMRGEWEASIQSAAEESRLFELEMKRRLAGELDSWLQEEGIAAALTRHEGGLLAKPVGQWTSAEALLTGWRAEALTALAWALYWMEAVPSYEAPVPTKEILLRAQALKPTKARIQGSRLRSAREIQREHLRAFVWQARSALHAQRDTKQETDLKYAVPQEIDIRHAFDESFQKARHMGLFPHDQHDLRPFGIEFEALPVEMALPMLFLASQREAAMRWLFGEAKDWDDLEPMPSTLVH